MEHKTNICDLLARWGVWCRRNPTLGVAPLIMWDDGTGKGDMDSMADDDALLIDKCVCALKAHDLQAYEILKAKYVYRGTIRKISDVMKLPKFVVCEQVKVGETFVWGFYEAQLIMLELNK